MGRDEKSEARSVITWSRRDENGSLVVDPKVEQICRARCHLDGFDPEEKIKISEQLTKGLHTLDYHTIYMRGWQMYVDEVETELQAPETAPALTKLASYQISPWDAIEGEVNVKPTGK